MNPIFLESQPPTPPPESPRPGRGVPWGRIIWSLTGTALLIALTCRDGWGSGGTMFAWFVLQACIWGSWNREQD